MDIKAIKELITVINKTEITEVEIEDKDFKIKISKNKNIVAPVQGVAYAEPVMPAVSQNNFDIERQGAETAVEEKSILDDEDVFVLRSPIVGTFYDSPSPDSDPFVKVGDKVKAGDVMCIVEAMKIMNEIKSEVDGTIIEILSDLEDVVEYNQPLMLVRRS